MVVMILIPTSNQAQERDTTSQTRKCHDGLRPAIATLFVSTVAISGNEAVTSMPAVVQSAMLGEHGKHRGRPASERRSGSIPGHVVGAN